MSTFLSLVKLFTGWGTYRNGVTGIRNLKGKTAGVAATLLIAGTLPTSATLQQRNTELMAAGLIIKKIT